MPRAQLGDHAHRLLAGEEPLLSFAPKRYP
jgi:hypothetical protein